MGKVAILLLIAGGLMIVLALFKTIGIWNSEEYSAWAQGEAGFEADWAADDLRTERNFLAVIGTICIIAGYIILKVKVM